MRNRIIVFAAMATLSILGASAQSASISQQEKNSRKINELWNKTKGAAEQAGSAVGNFFGFDDRVSNDDDLIKIKRNYYMPLYSVHLYKGADAAGFPAECRALFARRFPLATITSVALPQTQWVKEEVKKNNMVVGHVLKMYCYIIACDGEDGYINARFSYKMFKGVGSSYERLEDNWPRWERTDYLSHDIYSKLLTK